MRTRLAFWTGLTVLALATLFVGMGGTASAQTPVTPQTATPQPSPTNNGGTATWTIKGPSFKAHWPTGFDFALDATSSAGKITLATVSWNYSPKHSNTTGGKVDPSGKITATWDTTKSSVPQWVGVDYQWKLQDAAGNVYVTPRKYEEYADDTRKWNRMESEDVIVFTQDGVDPAVGPQVIAALRSESAKYFLSWGKLLNYRPRVIVYSSYDAWTEWDKGIDIHSPNGMHIGGLTDSSWGGTVQLFESGPGGRPVQEAATIFAYGTVLHEVEHLYQAAFSNQPSLCWFYEGDATYFEERQDYDYLGHVQQIAASGNFPTLQGDGPSCDGDNARDGYDIGYAFWRWLAETYGPDAHKTVWLGLADGQSVENAIKAVTKEDFVGTETDFRKWLGIANAVPPTLIPTPELSFPPTPDPNKQ